jgi:hypothetical protein
MHVYEGITAHFHLGTTQDLHFWWNTALTEQRALHAEIDFGDDFMFGNAKARDVVPIFRRSSDGQSLCRMRI